jgi:hypothetical protein
MTLRSSDIGTSLTDPSMASSPPRASAVATRSTRLILCAAVAWWV